MKSNLFGVAEAEVTSTAEMILEKQEEYKNYIDTHIANVKRAFDEIEEKIRGKAEDIDTALNFTKDFVAVHDLSKYGDDEFDAYRNHFYPIEGEEIDDEAFEKAWKHHYAVNPHHPDHWRSDNKPLDMPLGYIIEMICDWESFKYIDKGSAAEYWNNIKSANNNEITYMTQHTIDQVERILKLMEE